MYPFEGREEKQLAAVAAAARRNGGVLTAEQMAPLLDPPEYKSAAGRHIPYHAAGVLDLLVLQGNAWMYYDVLYIEEKVRRYIHACMRASINRLPLHGILLNSNNCNTIQYNTPEYARIQYKYKTIHTIQHNTDTIRQYNTTQLTIQHTTIYATPILDVLVVSTRSGFRTYFVLRLDWWFLVRDSKQQPLKLSPAR